MDSLNIARSDLVEPYLDRGRELLSAGFAWVLQLIGQPQGVTWDVATKFLSDYLLLPLIVLLVLLIVVKQAIFN